ncbi:FliM/FliN family flagellar motor switch protein [Oxalobacteraceae bacterium]|nr:FliM/FliN family flagellar motor switch protein [Oxalobacteraceae bacterium]
MPHVVEAVLARASITPADAALARLVGRGCQVGLEALDATLELQLADGIVADWSQALLMTGSFGVIELAQGARFLRALTGIDAGEGAVPGEYGHWLQAALLGRLAGTPFAAAERLLAACPQQASDGRVLRLSLNTGAHALVVYARAGAASWLALLGDTVWQAQRLPLAAFCALPLALTLPVARHSLPLLACRALAPGDVILPDHPYFSCDGAGRVDLGSQFARVSYLAPGALTIIALEGRMNMEEMNHLADVLGDAPASPAPGYASEAEAFAPLDALPLTLSFELGQARLSLGELCALGPGAILRFDGGGAAALAIMAQGRRLGQGEAVEVDGRLAIRITQWAVQ